jgi:hypothetical protein
MLFKYDNKFVSNPQLAAPVDLDDSVALEFWLGDPVQVTDEDEKEQAPCFCGSSYWPEAVTRVKEGLEAVHTLVLDVDAVPVPEADLLAALEGTRAVIYTSPRHTTAAPRWRVLLPLRTPLPPKKHRALVQQLSDGLIPGYPGCINVDSTGDPCRLGFFGATYTPADYRWHNLKGTRFDWSSLVLEDEVWSENTTLGGLERSPLWTDRPSALRAAIKRFESSGRGLRPGEGRTKVLWDVALQCWWAWAAEDEDFVMSVLRSVNEGFAVPEDEDELQRQMHEAHKRTVGERRQPQDNGTYGWAREPTNLIGHATIIEHAKRMRARKNTPDTVTISQALKRMAKSETLSDDPVSWRGLITKCAHELARAFPTETAERISSQFRGSLATMRASGKTDVPSENEVYAFVLTRLNSVQRQREEQEARKLRARESLIETATGGRRDASYTADEIQHWRRTVGLNDHNWLIANGSSVYVFSNGAWVGPFHKELEFEAQGRKALVAAEEAGRIRAYVFTDKGDRLAVPLKDLLNEYGCVAPVRIDLHVDVEKSYFSTEDNTLVVGAQRRRPLEPRYHAEVDQYLRIACGRDGDANKAEAAKWTENDEFDAVCDWMASLVEVQHPCRALYLQGPPNVGKGLFSDGCGRIWMSGHIGIADAFHHFNTMLAESPFVLVDEGFPPGLRAGDLLRRGLAQREHTFTKKRENSVKVRGCVRVLITANNLNIFNGLNQDLQREDIEALAQRFVHVRVREAAGEYLRSLGKRHHDFVEQNMIAEHALWLHEKRWAAILARGERFLTSRPSTVVADVVATSDPVANAICTLVVTTLTETAAAKIDWLLVDEELELWVNQPKLLQMLKVTEPGLRELSMRSLLRALGGLGALEPSRRLVKGTKMRFWHLSADTLTAWADNTGADTEALQEGLTDLARVQQQRVLQAATDALIEGFVSNLEQGRDVVEGRCLLRVMVGKRQMATALRSLGAEYVRGRTQRFWVVPRAQVVEWAERQGVLEPVEALLQKYGAVL